MRRAEPLAHTRDARQDLARDDHRLGHGFQLLEAVVAGAAVIAIVALAEVGEQMTMTAAHS